MPSTAKKNDLLAYKRRPLMRKGNIIYYGSMSDSHIILIQILDTTDYKNTDLRVARKVSVQLQQTAPGIRARDRIVKKTEKNSLWAAMDIATIWLNRVLNHRSGRRSRNRKNHNSSNNPNHNNPNNNNPNNNNPSNIPDSNPNAGE